MIERGTPPDAPGALEQRGQIRVHVAWVTLAAGDLSATRGDLPQGLAVVGDVGHYDQDLFALAEGEVLGGGQGEAGGEQPLGAGITGQVEKKDRACERPALLHPLTEELGALVGDTDAVEDTAQHGSGAVRRKSVRSRDAERPSHNTANGKADVGLWEGRSAARKRGCKARLLTKHPASCRRFAIAPCASTISMVSAYSMAMGIFATLL